MLETGTQEPRGTSAIEDLADDPSSRKRFLKAVGGTGAAGAFALFLAACGQKKPKLTPGGSDPNTGAGTGTDQYGPGDLGIVRFAATVEMVEIAFYDAVAASGTLKGRQASIAKRFGEQEREHLKVLEGAIQKLGGQVPAKPKVKRFPVSNQQALLKFGLGLESLGASALLGQADRIKSREILAAALTMHSVEGRHAATFASMLGQNPVPDGPFARPAFAADVLNQLHSLTAES